VVFPSSDKAATLDAYVSLYMEQEVYQESLVRNIGDFNLSFWRSQRGVEVDFIVYGNEGFYAIEVKNSKRIRPNDLTGLNEFGQDYPECRRVFLYRGEERLLKNGILIVPVEEFLRKLKLGKTIDSILSFLSNGMYM
jgi:predicted AAA+ superfamily ATPase